MSEPLQLRVCSEAEADLYAYRRRREADVAVRMIRGQRCGTLQRCMGEWAAALQFPYCFEETWESFAAQLAELQWGEGMRGERGGRDARGVLIVTNLGEVLPRSAADFAAMLRCLAGHVCQKPVELILHCESRDRQAVERRLAVAGFSGLFAATT